MVRWTRLIVTFFVHTNIAQYGAQHVVFTLHASALDAGFLYWTMTIAETPIIFKI